MCIRDSGNIVLDIDPADLKDGGYTYGDLLTVTVNGTGYDMPPVSYTHLPGHEGHLAEGRRGH